MSTGWIGSPASPCATCGRPGEAQDARCDACWEVEWNLGSYLDRGGAKAIEFVAKKLGEAATALDAKSGER